MALPRTIAEENIDRRYDCERCRDEMIVDVIGDAGEIGWDVVDVKPCPECNNQD